MISVIEECPNNPCQNGGTCSKQGSSITCTCTTEFTGLLCEERSMYII